MNGDGRGPRSGPEPQLPAGPAGTLGGDECYCEPARKANDSRPSKRAIDDFGRGDNNEDGELEVVIAAAAAVAADAQRQRQIAVGCSRHGVADDGGGHVCVTSRKHSAPALMETRGGRGGDEMTPSPDNITAVTAPAAAAGSAAAAANGRGSASRRLSAGCRRSSSSAASSAERRDSRSLGDIADADDECLHCRAAADGSGEGDEHNSRSCANGVHHRQLRRHSGQLLQQQQQQQLQQRPQSHQRQQQMRHGRCGCQPQQCHRCCSVAVASSNVFVDAGVGDAAIDNSRAKHDPSSDDSDAEYSDGGWDAEADDGDSATTAPGCSRGGNGNAPRRYSSTDCHRCGGGRAAAAAAAGYVSGRQRLSLPIDDRRSAAAAAAAAAALTTPDLRRASKMHQRSKTVANLLGVPTAKMSRDAAANGGGSGCDLRYARERSPSTEKDVWQRVKAKLSKYVFSPNIHSVDSKMAFLLNHEWANNSGLGGGSGVVGGDGRHSASSSPPGGRRRPYRKGRSMEVDRMQASAAGGCGGPSSPQQLQQQQQQQQQQPRRASYDCSDKPSGSGKAPTRALAAARNSNTDIIISAEMDAEALGRALQDMLLSVPAATAAAAAAAAAATAAATAAMEKPQAQSLG